MAELNISRVFLILALVCLMEISSQNLVNEDYYSLEDTSSIPTEAPTNNKNIVKQNTSADALKQVSTSKTAINIMETDVGSGDGDLSTEKYLLQEHAVEDLPSADDIFETFENETTEATTTSNDLETTKDEHIKQIFQKLGVTKDIIIDLFETPVTESIGSARRVVGLIDRDKELKDGTGENDAALNLTHNTELEEEFLLSASVNGHLRLTNLESAVLIDNKERSFLEKNSKSAAIPVYTNKEIEDEFFNIISDKDEEIFSKSFDMSSENKEFIGKFQSSEDKKLADTSTRSDTKTNNQEEEEVTAKTEAVTILASLLADVTVETFKTTPKLELIDKTATFDEDTAGKGSFSSGEVNYESYYGSSFEKSYTHLTRLANSVTVDPVLYEYEAHSSEDETILSTTVKVPAETSESIFTTNELSMSDNSRQNKRLDLNKHGRISDKLDFEGTTITAVQEGFNEVTTEKPFLGDYFHPAIDTDVNTEEIKLLSASESRNLYTVTTGQVTEEIESLLTERTTQYSFEEIVTDLTATYRFITEAPIEQGNSMDEALTDALKTSTVTSTTLSNGDITTEAIMSQNSHVAFDDDIISITTHTPTSRILTESVSLVTENKVTSNEETILQKNLSVPKVNPCLKLKFTGQLKTNETMMPIPDNASFFGTCDSNGVFVNVSWENKHKVKAILFFNFTENLLTNVQLNLLSDNTLFEQSKRVELRSTSNEITIEFENEHSLDFTFFEFSTHYHDSSLISSTERFEVAPSSEELQRSTSLVVLQITIGCVGLVVVIAVAAFYAFKKYRGQRDNFKLNAETA